MIVVGSADKSRWSGDGWSSELLSCWNNPIWNLIFQYKPEESQPHMDKVRPSNLNSGFAGSDVGGRVIYFLPCLLACNLMVNPDCCGFKVQLASEVFGWQKLHSALHPVQCCARSAACGEEWRSCRHFCSPGAGCDGLSRLHRTAIRQHFKFHLKPRDLVCIKKCSCIWSDFRIDISVWRWDNILQQSWQAGAQESERLIEGVAQEQLQEEVPIQDPEM